ncbi:MAG: hypothetical protein KA445_00325 [Sediminibacterium sp.]|nr:hypothetical protein [Sediminibacterium sp.]
MLQLIADLQTKNDPTNLNGSFPSYRKYFFSNQLKPEDNVFFTSLVLFNLGQFKDKMHPEELALLDQCKTNALPYLDRFKNKKNQLTYNFWPRNPPQIFPNGGWLNLFNQKFALADDIDDASITLLALGVTDSLAKAMQTKFGAFRVGLIKSNRSFYKAYKNKPVYSTWLGHKMPKDVDLSVLSNVLLMHTIAKIPLNATDSASLDLIVDLMKENKHLKDPKFVSQHYANTATILYHVARLIYYSDYPPLLALKPILLDQTKSMLTQSKYPLEQLLLNTSILRLGGEVELPSDTASLSTNNYPYFVANIASVLNNPFKRIVNQSNIVRFDYFSYAFNLSLLYENWMLRVD